jgi:thiol-disulfide isomerase/thioredoxin
MNKKTVQKSILIFLISITFILLAAAVHAEDKITVYFFWGKGCPHCEKEKLFLETLKTKYPQVVVRSYEVWYDQENAKIFTEIAEAYGKRPEGVPMTFIGDFRPLVGYRDEEITGKIIEDRVRYCTTLSCIDPIEKLGKPFQKTIETEEDEVVSLPLFGKIDTTTMALPALTVMLAGLDGFNPCAFFVLFTLLGILVHAQSRQRMILIGGTFVFFSGFIYFVFMAAWLNLFLHIGQLKVITVVAGITALIIASINIKDFFFFKKGVSLAIPEKAKPKLFERMRNLLKATSLTSMFIGTIVLAVAANAYELLCTIGFPMVFTRVLTLHNLPKISYYVYLFFYNIVYVIPLAAIVSVFTITLGSKKLTERQGQVLKLISGLMMLGLGLVLLINPALFHNPLIAAGLLAIALLISGILILVTKKSKNKR